MPLRKSKFNRLTVPSANEDVEELELSYTADRNVKWRNHFGKQPVNFLKGYTDGPGPPPFMYLFIQKE